MVRDVSEDHIYDTIEFNEFLQMMSKQQKFGMTEDSLKDAFRYFSLLTFLPRYIKVKVNTNNS
jgi:Ca2+-binding EF-hand superfamily protein